VVLCIQDRTFVWLMQRHYNLCVQMEKEQDHSHAKEFEHHHVQLQGTQTPYIFLESIMQCRKIQIGVLEYFFFHFFLGLLPIC